MQVSGGELQREQSFICILPPRHCSRGRIAQNHQNKNSIHWRDSVIARQCFRFIVRAPSPGRENRHCSNHCDRGRDCRPSPTTIEFIINKEKKCISGIARQVRNQRQTLQQEERHYNHLPLHCQDVWGGVFKIPPGTRGVLNWKESTCPGWTEMNQPSRQWIQVTLYTTTQFIQWTRALLCLAV